MNKKNLFNKIKEMTNEVEKISEMEINSISKGVQLSIALEELSKIAKKGSKILNKKSFRLL